MPSRSEGWGGAEREPDRAKHKELFKSPRAARSFQMLTKRTDLRRRSFQLDDVALRIGQVNRRAVAFGAITGFDFAGFDSSTAKVREYPVSIEWFDPKTEVIQISAARAWSGSADFAQGAVDRNEVNEGISRAKLVQAQIFLNLFYRAPDDIHIEIEHRFQ